jgi:hypothetical protein
MGVYICIAGLKHLGSKPWTMLPPELEWCANHASIY